MENPSSRVYANSTGEKFQIHRKQVSSITRSARRWFTMKDIANKAASASNEALRARLARAPLLLLAMTCLAAGVWAGLARLYWSLVPVTELNVNWVTFHGPLMVCGFLGTLIGVERAAALERWWAYVGPILTAAGGLLLIAGSLSSTPPALFVLGGLCLAGVTIVLLVRYPSGFLAVMAGGAVAWLAGNVLWWWGWPVHRVVPWWMAFLLLTIVAERWELSRFLQLTGRQRASLSLAATAFAVGVVVTAFDQLWGERLAGAGMLTVAAWLLLNDVARRTIRRAGAARFVACCLLIGYAWLAVAGLSFLVHAPLPKYGGAYDATLHTFFLGFVFSLIFGHATIVLPAVLRIEVPFSRLFYVHLAVWQAALVARVAGAIWSIPRLHGWGGTFQAVALAWFVLVTIGSAGVTALARRKTARQR